MATTTPDGIYSPDAGQQYALTQDLLAMADSVQDALTKRTAFSGPRADRLAAESTAPNGSIWVETDNLQSLYVKRAGQWAVPVPPRFQALWRRSDNQLAFNGSSTYTYTTASSTTINTLGVTAQGTAEGLAYRVPEAGVYEFSVRVPIASDPAGWTTLELLAPDSQALGGHGIDELNAASGFNLLKLTRVLFVPAATANHTIRMYSNVGGTMRSDGVITIRKLPNVW